MKTFKDLTPQQKMLFVRIEDIFIDNEYIKHKDFVTVLGILINKYKF